MKTRHQANKEDGFIAMLATVVLSAVVLAVILSLSSTSVAFRVSSLWGEFKTKSKAFAEACVQVAIGKIINNPEYAGVVEQISIGDITCKIVSVTKLNHQYTIRTQSVYPVISPSGAYTNLEVVFSLNDNSFEVVSRKELAEF
jgi:hypothetical protein